MKILVHELLEELIQVAEKSAQISRICRDDNDGLFRILIQEKINNDDGKNPRFQHDYKTFADVLIQEMAKFCLEAKFPGFSKQIYGEESNHFQNKLGEKISIQIGNDQQITYENFVKILDYNTSVSQKLVQVIYSSSSSSSSTINNSVQYDSDLPSISLELSDIAVWIDPIDSTSEYIKGQWNNTSDQTKLIPKGLHCVTCLFGVFDTRTGMPIIGVCNQPFYRKHDDGSYEGRYIWGYNIDHISRNNIDESMIKSDSGIILIGGKENIELKERINRFAKTMYVAGAGHKLLNVAIGKADLLLTSSKSTYYWDTCAIHAILRSIGGGIIPFENFIQINNDNIDKYLEHSQIRYKEKTMTMKNFDCNHSKGLIAYRSIDAVRKTLNLLKI
ncbi:inositol polyphosphate 1-phosphatase isoform X2 [Dermatophagoides pteronyssinus]|uniref:inositol polyphosphate 1-phosphatase isoform X2 n=1 Tax=Dermatophagoides pteronyssinus TaxID=6956 RepID=UPI003F663844